MNSQNGMSANYRRHAFIVNRLALPRRFRRRRHIAAATANIRQLAVGWLSKAGYATVGQQKALHATLSLINNGSRPSASVEW